MDIVPPPDAVEPTPARQWWTWVLFGCLAAFFVASNLYTIFAPGTEEEVDVISAERMAAPVALKQFVIFDKLSKKEGWESLGSIKKTVIDPAIEGFEEKLDQSEEAAAWILALETVKGAVELGREVERYWFSL